MQILTATSIRHRGSSPRTWGNVNRSRGRSRRRRFIPTHVGKWPEARPERPARSVHPHARGEMYSGDVGHRSRDGSSPRTWGNGLQPLHEGLVVRFIPTHVGKCSRGHVPSARQPVHPHARGEMIFFIMASCLANGSSPRTWGNVPGDGRRGHRRRFIPTHVGKWSTSRA